MIDMVQTRTEPGQKERHFDEGEEALAHAVADGVPRL